MMVHVNLKAKDREKLEHVVRDGSVSSRIFKRARALLALGRGESMASVAEDLNVHRVTVRAWRDGYKESGLAILQDKAHSGRPTTLDGLQRAKITALACSEAPDGHGQWPLRLLAGKAVELGYCESISHTQVRRVLKKRS